ncbi:Hypothetical protein A7982_02264 [Minicystis rosea]|nr:Hypothetical protein A7982_02264 [Minicystis rosea]
MYRCPRSFVASAESGCRRGVDEARRLLISPEGRESLAIALGHQPFA